LNVPAYESLFEYQGLYTFLVKIVEEIGYLQNLNLEIRESQDILLNRMDEHDEHIKFLEE